METLVDELELDFEQMIVEKTLELLPAIFPDPGRVISRVESTDYYRVTYLEAVADRDKEALKQSYEFSYAFTLDEGEREMIIQMKFTDEAYVRLQLFPINDVIGETYISDEEASDNTIIESWRESDKKEYSLAGLTLNNIQG